MSTVAIKLAFERALAAFPQALDEAHTQRENIAFAPKAGEPYWRINFIFTPPENPTFGDTFYRQRGFFQVTLCWPEGVGTGPPTAIAEALKLYLSRGLSLVANGVTTTVDGTPQIAGGRVEGDRWVVPIRARFFANILN